MGSEEEVREVEISGSSFSRAAAAVLACAALVGCGRSEEVGWGDREPPDSVERVERQAQVMEELKASPMGREIRAQAYQQLAESLEPLRERAMQDPQVAAIWEDLAEDVEAKIVAESDFHRNLVKRRAEIEALIGPGVTPPETLTEAEKAELARNHWNVQVEMARVRNIELRQPQFFHRLQEFRRVLFDQMREIAPERAAEIDRMQELEEEIIEPAPAEPIPSMGLPR